MGGEHREAQRSTEKHREAATEKTGGEHTVHGWRMGGVRALEDPSAPNMGAA